MNKQEDSAVKAVQRHTNGTSAREVFHLVESGLNLIEQGLTIFDRNLKLVLANQTFSKLYDLPQSYLEPGTTFEAINRFLAEKGDFGPGDVEELVRERVERAKAFEDHYFERERPGGTIIAVEGHALHQGGWVSVYTDITDQKNKDELLRERSHSLYESLLERSEKLSDTNRELNSANRALEETRRKLIESDRRTRTITQSVPAHIAYIDRDLCYRFTNNQFSQLLGREVDRLLDAHVSDVFEADVAGELADGLAAAFAGEALSIELNPRDPNGALHTIKTTLVPDVSESGEVSGAYVMSIDITEEKKAMEMLVHTKRMEAAQQLTSGVVHDFSNILTIISGNLDRLADPALDPAERQRIVLAAKRATQRGSRVTDQLMSFSRNQEWEPTRFDVCEVLEELVRLFSASLDPAVGISLSRHETPLFAHADERGLQDAVLNLLMNARDAVGASGSITIAVNPSGDARRIEVTVKDDGCGFEPGTIEKASKAFFSTKQGGRGRGLGLSMVKRFMKHAGGQMAIESLPGEGARITLCMPTATAEVSRHGPLLSQDSEPTAPHQDLFRPELVLVVDDEADIRNLVRDQLVDGETAVIEAASADEAHELLKSLSGIDMVISDVMMPGKMNGVELADMARQARPKMPVLLMTGMNSDHPLYAEAKTGYLVLDKPFDAAGFQQAFKAAIGGTETRNAPQATKPLVQPLHMDTD